MRERRLELLVLLVFFFTNGQLQIAFRVFSWVCNSFTIFYLVLVIRFSSVLLKSLLVFSIAAMQACTSSLFRKLNNIYISYKTFSKNLSSNVWYALNTIRATRVSEATTMQAFIHFLSRMKSPSISGASYIIRGITGNTLSIYWTTCSVKMKQLEDIIFRRSTELPSILLPLLTPPVN